MIYPRSIDTNPVYRVSQHDMVVSRAGNPSRRGLLHVAGEIDVASADGLSRALIAELDAGYRYLRLDLSAVTLMDTTAVAALAQAHDRFLAARGTLVLVGLSEPVRRLLEITKLDRVLLIAAPDLQVSA